VGKLRGYFDVGFALFLDRYKWLLAVMVLAGIVVGALFAAGIFGVGGNSAGDLAPQVSVAATTPTPIPPTGPEATATPTPEPTSTPPPTPRPTVAALTGVGFEPDDDQGSEFLAQKQVQVPINLLGASDLGSLEFVLVFEAATLEFVGIDQGALALDAIIESNLRAPGKVWVGMIDPRGVNGDGSIAVVSFRTLAGGQADSPLLLEDVLSHKASTLLDSLSKPSPGIFTLRDSSVSSPVLTFE